MNKEIEETKKLAVEILEEYARFYSEIDAEVVAGMIVNAGYRKQKVGEWVKVMNHRECSICGYNAPYKKIKAGYHLQDLTKYCPNCGAKMEGGEG